MVRKHRVFALVVMAGALLRIVAMIGYRPVMWFSDSFDYVHVALSPFPHPIRPSGYSLLLWVLGFFHSFVLVAAVQHLMGMASAVMIYALLRKRFRLPGWGATLAAAPVLFDGYQIQLEHMILSDTMFEVLLVSVVTLLLWHGTQLTWKVGGIVGLLLGLASLTRSVGLPVLLAVMVYFLIRRINWRAFVATIALCALPIAAYAGWFWSWYGKPGLTESNGIFLYARVMEFADCKKINPPVEEYPLCIQRQHRLPFSQSYIWDRRSALHRIDVDRFTARQNALANDLAKRAILAQPGDYLRVTAADFLRTFQWDRTVYPDRATYMAYEFGTHPSALGTWRVSKDRTAAEDAKAYERGDPTTRVVTPYATAIRDYQRFVYLRGTMLGGILIIGLVGLVPLWRRWGGAAFLPWITATGLLLVPPATAEFDYRYVLPTVPLACIAAAIAFSAEPRRRLARALPTGGSTAESSPKDAVPA
ncbi:hypothetical protein NE236_17530 [Actinoallomurus purpureus]|uniref:hypothetical protein n=1 Tax=Actinoallomurus purpureus TaxID=478114 RepID=UPI0020939A6F|nr:hypothetical protein [Actinoallomurus purpureus]MCO6006790.1 hypothetical protein [Actinoallomurus purpureus]